MMTQIRQLSEYIVRFQGHRSRYSKPTQNPQLLEYINFIFFLIDLVVIPKQLKYLDFRQNFIIKILGMLISIPELLIL